MFHFPHYDHGNFGPASAIVVGQFKLIRVYENGARLLYDLSRDAAERHDLAATLPEKVADLDARLTAYLQSVNAQFATKNPDYDPSKADAATDQPARKGGGKGGQRRQNQ